MDRRREARLVLLPSNDDMGISSSSLFSAAGYILALFVGRSMAGLAGALGRGVDGMKRSEKNTVYMVIASLEVYSSSQGNAIQA